MFLLTREWIDEVDVIYLQIGYAYDLKLRDGNKSSKYLIKIFLFYLWNIPMVIHHPSFKISLKT